MNKTVVNMLGIKQYYNDEGELYREEGPNGYEAWYINGLYHREDGPAVTYINGNKVWYINGQLHREDGPAVEFSNGKKEWHYNDKLLDCKNQEEFDRLMKLELFW